MDITYSRPRKPMPDTTDGKLEDIIKRLGRIEKHLIDIRDNRPAELKPEREPEPKLKYDPDEF